MVKPTMSEAIIEAVGLCRDYPARGGSGHVIRALSNVDLRVEAGQVLGVVGSSGAGKSTLARLLLALERPDAGSVHFDGQPISVMTPRRVRPLRRRFQAVFQDPLASLDPRLSVGTIVSEPLVSFGIGTTAERRTRVRELLARVGLPEDAARRLPSAFSGGERQRIAIARAMAPGPALLILDEPVSFLDVSIRGEILKLLNELRHRHSLSMVFISHDLRVVRQVCDRIAVLLDGVIVEQGPADSLLDRPAHPYTAAMVAATPVPDPAWRPPRQGLFNLGSWPTGACRYAVSCDRASEECNKSPALAEIGEGRSVRCHHPIGNEF